METFGIILNEPLAQRILDKSHTMYINFCGRLMCLSFKLHSTNTRTEYFMGYQRQFPAKKTPEFPLFRTLRDCLKRGWSPGVRKQICWPSRNFLAAVSRLQRLAGTISRRCTQLHQWTNTVTSTHTRSLTRCLTGH